ncbi:MAG: hypothetical protein HQM09_23285 [Candidatus Riflebacteria bacterium]|nr:hypothetical protein [Candidatus Riflebacteria bacterium]
MNGQERAEQNFLAFQGWVATKIDDDFREMVFKGRLNRGEICRECNFARSVLAQNPRIKSALRDLEYQLRVRGVLPLLIHGEALPLRAKGQMQSATDADRLRKLEAENAGLRAELAEMRNQLKKFKSIENILAETGRLAR